MTQMGTPGDAVCANCSHFQRSPAVCSWGTCQRDGQPLPDYCTCSHFRRAAHPSKPETRVEFSRDRSIAYVKCAGDCILWFQKANGLAVLSVDRHGLTEKQPDLTPAELRALAAWAETQ